MCNEHRLAAPLVEQRDKRPAVANLEMPELACHAVVGLNPMVNLAVVVLSEVFAESGTVLIRDPITLDHVIGGLAVQVCYVALLLFWRQICHDNAVPSAGRLSAAKSVHHRQFRYQQHPPSMPPLLQYEIEDLPRGVGVAGREID